MANPKIVHVTEAPARLPLSQRTGRRYTTAWVYQWIKDGRLTPVRRSGTTYVAVDELRELAAEIALRSVPA